VDAAEADAETEREQYRRARGKAMDLLARREHAVAELRDKLTQRDMQPALVARVLDELQAEGLLSDARFAEAYVRYRRNSGHGPQRIRQELRQRGVEEALQATWLESAEVDWSALARQARSKRFGADLPGDYKERARQARFLQYRGFTSEQIQAALGDED